MTAAVGNIYKSGILAATLTRTPEATTFSYHQGYSGPVIGHCLPLGATHALPGAAIPAWFANLLPEGRRLTSLTRHLKISADDDFSLLLASGEDPIGDVQILSDGILSRPEPVLPIDQSTLSFTKLIEQDYLDRSAISGVQDKLSSGMITIPISTPPGHAIIKLDPPDYPHAVRNEAFFLDLARKLKIPVSSHRIVFDCDNRPALVVDRFDRRATPVTEVQRIATEDGCQILNRYPADKYSVTAEELVLALAGVCSAPIVAARNAYLQFLFAWLTGDGDLHAKNLSVVQQPSGEWRMSPMYDVPSTLPYGDFSMALPIGNRRDGFIRKHLIAFGQEIGLSEAAATSALELALKATKPAIEAISSGILPFSINTRRNWVRQLSRRQKDASS